MKTIETTAEVGPNQQLVVNLPSDVPAGRHRIVLVIGETASEETGPEKPMRRRLFVAWATYSSTTEGRYHPELIGSPRIAKLGFRIWSGGLWENESTAVGRGETTYETL